MAMRTNMEVLVVVVMVAAAVLQGIGAQSVHVVGDAVGWTIPPNATTYSIWASSRNFTVGDILVFNFATNIHDVARVTKDAFDNCTITNPITLITNGPANFTLNSTGDYYFICTFSDHCSRGQKLDINVTLPPVSGGSPPPPPPGTTESPPPPPSNGSTPAPTGSLSPPPPPPPPGSSATSLGAATYFSVFISIAIWLLC